MRLSKRLETVASFVPKGSRLADVGTDHGYVPIYLALQNQISHGIAMDVRSGPLDRAREHVTRYGLNDRIELRLSDGMKELRAGEADTVVIAGMGGELMMRILEEGSHVRDSVLTWILSPQSDFFKVRQYLQEQGFCIDEETMLADEGKYYTVMKVSRGLMRYEREIELKYGKHLLDSRHPVLKSFLEKELRLTGGILGRLDEQESAGAGERRAELTREYLQMKEAYDEVR